MAWNNQRQINDQTEYTIAFDKKVEIAISSWQSHKGMNILNKIAISSGLKSRQNMIAWY